MDYAKYMEKIRKHISQKEYESSVAECGCLCEEVLRELVKEFLLSVRSSSDREAFLLAEKTMAKTEIQTFHDFSLGQLIGLYREGNIFAKLRKTKKLNLKKTGRIKWDDLCELRNVAVHRQEKIDQDDAVQMYLWVNSLLYDLGGIEKPEDGSHLVPAEIMSDEETTICNQCSSELSVDWKFCPNCGSSIFNICEGCDRRLMPEWNICPYCETKMRGQGKQKNSEAKQEYLMLCRGACLDQIINAKEKEMLEDKRLELGLSFEEAEEIKKSCLPPEILEYENYLEGVYIDGVVNEDEREFLTKKARELNIEGSLAKEIEKEYQIYLGLKQHEEPA